jgi:8-oxo-dGTP diphosphatase
VNSAPVIAVAAGLIFRAGRLLITRRPEGSHLAGLWEFPGGKLEPGETWEAALSRELHEELGVTVSVGRQFTEVCHAYPGKTVRLRFFVCTLEQGEPRPLGCAAVSWVTATELPRYAFPPADEQLLAQLPRAPEFGGESL